MENRPNEVDTATFDELKGILGDALVDVLESYVDDAARILAQIETGERESDAEAVSRAAHQLKSSSASVGAIALSELMREIEVIARGGSIDGVAELHARAKDSFAQVHEFFSHTMSAAA